MSEFLKNLMAAQAQQQRGDGPSYPLIGQCHIGPSPIPTEYSIGEARGPGGRIVVLQISTPLGVQFYFMDPDSAATFADRIRAIAAGIIVPVASAAPPPINGTPKS